MSAPAATLVDPERLAAWMDTEGLEPGATLRVERITTGHSNEVFRLERGVQQWALRRPPRTPLSPTAHDMAREYRLLRAFGDPSGWIGREPVPVPKPVALCTDTDVIGAPFYVMELLDGVVVRERIPAPLASSPDSGRECALAMMDALAGIHAFRGKPVGSRTTAVPTATSNGRCRAGSGNSTVTAHATSPRSTRRAGGSRRTRRPCNRRPSSTVTTSSTT